MLNDKSLAPPKAYFEIKISSNITFVVRPLSLFDLNLCRAAVDRIVPDLALGKQVLEDVGLSTDTSYNPDDTLHVDAMRETLLIKEIGKRHIVGWEWKKGLAFNEANILQVLEDWTIARVFYEQVMKHHYLLSIAKKKFKKGVSGS